MMKSKVCSKCKEEKDISCFTKRGDSERYRSHCKECNNSKNKERYDNSDRKSLEEENLRLKSSMAPEGYKYCRVCDNYKTLDSFYNADRPDGKRSNCKDCHAQDGAERYQEEYKGTEKQRNRLKGGHLKRQYNITPADYNKLLEDQNFCCAGCGRHVSEFKNALAVDHDHNCCKEDISCGRCIRGLLCQLCNTGIGLLGDNIEGVKKALDYLDRGYVIIESL